MSGSTELVRHWVDGEDERLVVQAAQGDGRLVPVFGYAATDRRGPAEATCFLDRDGRVLDPQRHRRTLLGLLGIPLRAIEAANWLPGAHQRHPVAGRRLHGYRSAA